MSLVGVKVALPRMNPHKLPSAVRYTGPALDGSWAEAVLERMNAASRRGINWFESQSAHDVRCEVARTTILLHTDGRRLETPEHLSAAMLGWPQASVRLRTTTGKIPLADGSAALWVALLEELLGPATDRLELYNAPLTTGNRERDWFWECAPNEQDLFSVHYSLDRHGYRSEVHFRASTWQDLWPVLQARTFIIEDDWNAALAAGILSPNIADCGVLIRGQGHAVPEVLHGAPLRSPDEPLWHKILDLIGDLVLFGPFLPKLQIRIHNGGHVAHQQILARLLPYVAARHSSQA